MSEVLPKRLLGVHAQQAAESGPASDCQSAWTDVASWGAELEFKHVCEQLDTGRAMELMEAQYTSTLAKPGILGATPVASWAASAAASAAAVLDPNALQHNAVGHPQAGTCAVVRRDAGRTQTPVLLGSSSCISGNRRWRRCACGCSARTAASVLWRQKSSARWWTMNASRRGYCSRSGTAPTWLQYRRCWRASATSCRLLWRPSRRTAQRGPCGQASCRRPCRQRRAAWQPHRWVGMAHCRHSLPCASWVA